MPTGTVRPGPGDPPTRLHGDVPHGDAPHGDVPHRDVPHKDTPHRQVPPWEVVAVAEPSSLDPRDDLDGLDPFDLLDIEAARISTLLSCLPSEAWSRPTRCTEWTVRDLLAHLATLEEYRHACLDDTVGGLLARARAAGVTDTDSFNAWGVAARRDVPAPELLARWQQDGGDNRRRLRWHGPRGTVSTATGWCQADMFCWYLAAEYATHADDLGAPVGSDEVASRSDWRARFTRVALAESGRPVEVVRVPAGYRVRVRGDQLTLSPAELADAGSRRLGAHRAPPGVLDVLAVLA